MLFMKILSSRRSRQDFNDILDLCHFLGITDEVGIHVAVLPFGDVDGDLTLMGPVAIVENINNNRRERKMSQKTEEQKCHKHSLDNKDVESIVISILLFLLASVVAVMILLFIYVDNLGILLPAEVICYVILSIISHILVNIYLRSE